MAGVRVSSEWGFNVVTNTYQGVDMARWERAYLTYPATRYKLATLLATCILCVRGQNQISAFFDLEPPSLEEYLAGQWAPR